MDKVQTSFESWISNTRNFKKYGMKLNKTSDGNYGDFRINNKWLAWKACYSWVTSSK